METHGPIRFSGSPRKRDVTSQGAILQIHLISMNHTSLGINCDPQHTAYTFKWKKDEIYNLHEKRWCLQWLSVFIFWVIHLSWQ